MVREEEDRQGKRRVLRALSGFLRILFDKVK